MNIECNETYLYKVLSVKNWKLSQESDFLILSPMDQDFIHLAKEEQVERIVNKFWKQEPEYVLITLNPSSLEGNLVYESNPGGKNKYYHLYDGKIPLEAVVDWETIEQ